MSFMSFWPTHYRRWWRFTYILSMCRKSTTIRKYPGSLGQWPTSRWSKSNHSLWARSWTFCLAAYSNRTSARSVTGYWLRVCFQILGFINRFALLTSLRPPGYGRTQSPFKKRKPKQVTREGWNETYPDETKLRITKYSQSDCEVRCRIPPFRRVWEEGVGFFEFSSRISRSSQNTIRFSQPFLNRSKPSEQIEFRKNPTVICVRNNFSSVCQGGEW